VAKKKKSKKSGGGKKGGNKARKSQQVASATNPSKAKAKDESKSEDKASAKPAAKTEDKPKAAAKAKAKPAPKAKAKPAEKATVIEPKASEEKPPDIVVKITMVDNAIGYFEQAFLVFALFSLVAVGTYQFVASHIFSVNHTWPFGALRNLVFFTAMGGAALAAQKGRMISMDFLARQFSPKNRVVLRILISFFVVFTCYLLYKGGVFVREAANPHHEVLGLTSTIGVLFEKLINVIINPKTALLVLPAGAALIAVHYALHALTDALYLAAGQIPPEEEGPAAH
jgi:TRAP-type C4-dicarboxylate transport system permease small subunit